MKIELTHIKISELFDGYKDSGEGGVVAYGGRLDVRPKYQREFVYKDKQRDAVIDTVLKGFPLNVMYWVKNDDRNFEVLDGQQRTISICQFLNHDFSVKYEHFDPLYCDTNPTLRQRILDYELMVYICEGDDNERLAWFRTINIAGEKLSDQELRNANYPGEWLTNAKRYFSRSGCAAMKIGDKYVKADVVRQGLLEKALAWISLDQHCSIEAYMAKHQHDKECSELWEYYRNVIDWATTTFTKYRKEMASVDWGMIYPQFKNNHYDTTLLEAEVSKLMADDDVTKKVGIYYFVLTHDERHLSIRAFDNRDKRTAFERQKGVCPVCGKTFKIEEMEADHIKPWSKGGKTVSENCQMLCRECNRKKGNNDSSKDDQSPITIINTETYIHNVEKVDKLG